MADKNSDAPKQIPVPNTPKSTVPDKIPQEPKAPSGELSMVENFMLSGIAAIVSKTAAAPIERVKLLVQTQGEMIKKDPSFKRYKSIGECFRRTHAQEGFASFWRGNSANVLRYFPTQALNFAFKGRIKKSVGMKKTDSNAMRLFKNVLSGGLAGSMSLSFVYSLDYARTRLANDIKNAGKGGKRTFNGLVDVYKQTLRSDGMGGLYRGFGISVVGIFIYRGLYFGLYDTIKPIVSTNDNLLLNFIIGYLVTISAGLISYPIDTIRRRMMMTSGTGVLYKSSIDCCIQVMKKEGPASLMKGAGANIMRGLAGAAVLALFDEFKKGYKLMKTGRK